MSVSCPVAQWVRKCRVTLYRAHAAKSRITVFRQLVLLAAGLRPKAGSGRAHLSERFDATGLERCVGQRRPNRLHDRWLWLGCSSRAWNNFLLRCDVYTNPRVDTVSPE